jgi:hypothetical protein
MFAGSDMAKKEIEPRTPCRYIDGPKLTSLHSI